MSNNTLSPVSRFMLVMAAFIVVIAGMRAAESLLVPFLLSLFIAIIVTPLLTWLKDRGVPSGIAIVLIIALVLFLGYAVGSIVGSSIDDFRDDLPFYQDRLLTVSDDLLGKLAMLGIEIESTQFREIFNPSAALTMAGNTLTGFGNVMADGFLILLTVVFILAEEVNFADKFRYATRRSSDSMDALHSFTSSVNKYMAIKTLISFMTGLGVMICLWLIGVDYFVLWGLLAFLLNFIPTLGSILAAIPPVLLALVQLGGFEATLTAIVFLAVNVIVGSILEPRFMGKGLNLSSLVVFLSLVFWGWVLGPVGMLLSVPLTITVKIALEKFDETRWIGIMLGSGTPVNQDEEGNRIPIGKIDS